MTDKTIGAVASVFFVVVFFIRLTHDSDSAALLWTSLDTSCLSLRRFHLNFQQQNFVKCRLIKNKNRYCGQLFLKHKSFPEISEFQTELSELAASGSL